MSAVRIRPPRPRKLLISLSRVIRCKPPAGSAPRPRCASENHPGPGEQTLPIGRRGHARWRARHEREQQARDDLVRRPLWPWPLGAKEPADVTVPAAELRPAATA